MENFAIILVILICLGFLLAVYNLVFGLRRINRNGAFTRQILQSIYTTSKIELDEIRRQVGFMNVVEFNRRMNLQSNRQKERYKLYELVTDLKRKEENPYTDAEMEFLTVPKTDEWQEEFED